MKRETQSVKQTSDLIIVSGIGSVRMIDGSIRDIYVYGYFERHNRIFLLSQYVKDTRYITITEGATGTSIGRYVYEDIISAFAEAVSFVDEKRYYFATKVKHLTTLYKCDLEKRNRTIQTLAIDSSLWM